MNMKKIALAALLFTTGTVVIKANNEVDGFRKIETSLLNMLQASDEIFSCLKSIETDALEHGFDDIAQTAREITNEIKDGSASVISILAKINNIKANYADKLSDDFQEEVSNLGIMGIYNSISSALSKSK